MDEGYRVLNLEHWNRENKCLLELNAQLKYF
jgi:hypothetical protein